jgi:hypothetical protein
MVTSAVASARLAEEEAGEEDADDDDHAGDSGADLHRSSGESTAPFLDNRRFVCEGRFGRERWISRDGRFGVRGRDVRVFGCFTHDTDDRRRNHHFGYACSVKNL